MNQAGVYSSVMRGSLVQFGFRRHGRRNENKCARSQSMTFAKMAHPEMGAWTHDVARLFQVRSQGQVPAGLLKLVATVR
jgi:hypothetical protein